MLMNLSARHAHAFPEARVWQIVNKPILWMRNLCVLCKRKKKE